MPEKIIVAVHGIGEQMRGETIRSVARRLCQYCGAPASMPLGRFGAELMVPSGAGFPGTFLVTTPPDPRLPPPPSLTKVGFGEVYWADVPRGPVAHRYTLDEAKSWAQTVAERARFAGSGRPYQFASTIIGGLIEGIRVLERLFFLAEKASLLKFDLSKILVDYLGDVQVVTEFRNYRRQILDTFHGVMAQVHRQLPHADIFLVAHSEGSVIAFLALLEALRGRESGLIGTGEDRKPVGGDWADQVKGLMTIGSPIGKHLLLWPWLWEGLQRAPGDPPPQGIEVIADDAYDPVDAGDPPPQGIEWRNYYDFGDPIGFGIKDAKDWLNTNGWAGFFDFGADGGDYGFTRYYFPGKAHTDYWDDADVFGHFFQKVVVPAGEQWQPPPSRSFNPPTTKRWAQVVSRVVPFVLALAPLLLGTYFLMKGVGEFQQLEEGGWVVLRNVLAVGFLLAGATVAARIPFRSANPIWVFSAFSVFALTLAVFPFLIDNGLESRLRALFLPWPGFPIGWEVPFGVPLMLVELLLVALALAIVAASTGRRSLTFGRALLMVVYGGALVLVLVPAFRFRVPLTTVVLLALAVLFVLAGCGAGRWFPKHGVMWVVLIGSGLVLGIAITMGVSSQSPGDTYGVIKHEVAKRTGLRGAKLDEVSSDVLGRFAAHEAPRPDVRAFARGEAEKIRHDNRYAEEVKETAPEIEFVGDSLLITGQECPVCPRSSGPVWPVVLAGAAFFYLWWVSALVLDLTVAWHHYIKGEFLLRAIEAIPKEEYAQAAGDRAEPGRQERP